MLALISGGGSALLALPAPGLTLADKQAVNRALLASGAPIDEMNCGAQAPLGHQGRPAGAAAAPARVVTLAISDVPGDDPAVIAHRPHRARPDQFRRCPRADRALRDHASPRWPPGSRKTRTRRRSRASLPHAEFRLIATPMMALRRGGGDGARPRAHAADPGRRAGRRERAQMGTVLAGIARSVRTHGHPLRAARGAALRRRDHGDDRQAAAPAAAAATPSSCSASRWRWAARRGSGRPPATPTASTAPRTRPAPSSRPTRWPAPGRAGSTRARRWPAMTATACSRRSAT